jgi:mycobactin salicyl-AMP ligase
MNAAALSTTTAESSQQMARRVLGLAALAENVMQSSPKRTAICDAEFADPAAGAPRTFSNMAMMREVIRVSAFLQVLKLPARSVISIAMPNRPETAIAILATLHAGHCPLVLPLSLDDDEMLSAIEKAGTVVAISVTNATGTDAAERMRKIAARYFGLRFIAAYGPDAPDGVISLDLLPSIKNEATLAPSKDPELHVLTWDTGRQCLIARSCDQLVATALPILSTASMMGGQRLISLLPPDDLAGLVLNLAGPLAAGLSVTTLDEFDSARLAATLATGDQAHLVAPAWIAPMLAESGLLESPLLCSLILVDKAPWHLPKSLMHKLPPHLRVIDVLAIDETGLFISVRQSVDCTGFSLAEPMPSVASGVNLLEARNEENRVWLRGVGVIGKPFEMIRTGAETPENRDQKSAPVGWFPTRFSAEIKNGKIVGLNLAST